jgi:hypothetical protein
MKENKNLIQPTLTEVIIGKINKWLVLIATFFLCLSLPFVTYKVLIWAITK